MIKVILWDIDGTILDFEASEKNAIRNCFEQFELGECTDEMLRRYSVINRSYWKRLERGELTKPEVLEGRFEEFFGNEGIRTDIVPSFNKEYQLRLADTICYNDSADEILDYYKGQIKQYAVTNGTKVAQERKLAKSGLDKVFDGIFISDEIGAEKPAHEFFEKVWKTIGIYDCSEILIIGDSLTSDMQGGHNEGIVCCWYNPKKMEGNPMLNIAHEISDLNQIKEIIDAYK